MTNLDEATVWLDAKARHLINASRRVMPNGVAAFPPQAGAGYEAFWLRDYAYMLEGCSDVFTHKELVDSCRVFIDAMRADGAGVDCVKFNGQPVYMPGFGTMGAHPVADGGPFTVQVAWHTYQQTKDTAFLKTILDSLVRTMKAVPRNPANGLVHIQQEGYDRCPYGFTDTVRKQGDELFCSLLYIQACRQLADLMEAARRTEEANQWRRESKRLEPLVRTTFWDQSIGLFRAATLNCRQPDLWGSAFAVYLQVATPEQSRIIAGYFKEHYREIVQCGQIRHLPGGMYWDAACPRDTYQNGGFWATATGWFVYVLDLVDPKLADQTMIDMVNDFRRRGVTEWILDSRTAVRNYIASATMPLAGVRRMLDRRGVPAAAKRVAPEEWVNPTCALNLAYVGNGAKPAIASSEYPDVKHQAKGLNDGRYGNDSCWIANNSHASFQIELARPAKVERFTLGRDRTGLYNDRPIGSLSIEVSLDAQRWETVFEHPAVSTISNYAPTATIEIQIPPAQAKYIRVTLDSPKASGMAAGIDEFEVHGR